MNALVDTARCRRSRCSDMRGRRTSRRLPIPSCRVSRFHSNQHQLITISCFLGPFWDKMSGFLATKVHLTSNMVHIFICTISYIGFLQAWAHPSITRLTTNTDSHLTSGDVSANIPSQSPGTTPFSSASQTEASGVLKLPSGPDPSSSFEEGKICKQGASSLKIIQLKNFSVRRQSDVIYSKIISFLDAS